jgi:protein SCO1/2
MAISKENMFWQGTFCACVLLLAGSALTAAEKIEVGIEEQLGKVLALETYRFKDEQGKDVVLKDFFDIPVALVPVYYRCPSICTPLLQEVTRVVELCELEPGVDYRLVTFSFNPKEGPDLARTKKRNMLATMEKKKVSEDAWRYLTGDQETITRLTQDIGFRYKPDETGNDFIHAATVVFISPQGKISRYLNGLKFNPADLKLAVVDAKEGRARSFMQKVQRLCYSYDPKGRQYVLQVNRIILAVTILFVLVFVPFLLRKRSTGKEEEEKAS